MATLLSQEGNSVDQSSRHGHNSITDADKNIEQSKMEMLHYEVTKKLLPYILKSSKASSTCYCTCKFIPFKHVEIDWCCTSMFPKTEINICKVSLLILKSLNLCKMNIYEYLHQLRYWPLLDRKPGLARSSAAVWPRLFYWHVQRSTTHH